MLHTQIGVLGLCIFDTKNSLRRVTRCRNR